MPCGLLQLQRLVGNRAVTTYLGGGGNAVVQREEDDLTPDHKRQQLRGPQQILRSAVTAQGLRTALGAVWDRYAGLDKKAANEKCKVAAIEISDQLQRRGIDHEWSASRGGRAGVAGR